LRADNPPLSCRSNMPPLLELCIWLQLVAPRGNRAKIWLNTFGQVHRLGFYRPLVVRDGDQHKSNIRPNWDTAINMWTGNNSVCVIRIAFWSLESPMQLPECVECRAMYDHRPSLWKNRRQSERFQISIGIWACIALSVSRYAIWHLQCWNAVLELIWCRSKSGSPLMNFRVSQERDYIWLLYR
jgi:hypothetical protein